MRLSSYFPSSPVLKGFVAPLFGTTPSHTPTFLNLGSSVRLEEAEKRNVIFFELLQQALKNVDFLLQSKCIALDIQIQLEERVLVEPSAFLVVLENLLSMAAKSSPTGGCLTVTFWQEPDQSVVVVKEESSQFGNAAAERLIGWFMGSKPKPVNDPNQVEATRRIIEQHGGRLTNQPGRGTCFAIQIPRI